MKFDIRNFCLAYRFSLSSEVKRIIELIFLHKTGNLVRKSGVKFVGIYYPVKREPSLLKLMEVAEEIRFYFPVMKEKDLCWGSYRGWNRGKINRYGIWEPERCDNEIPELILVPGVAFDMKGYRVGYGGGFFDRFLENYSGISVGIVYDRCLFRELPAEEHDIPVKLVVSEKKVVGERVSV